MRAASTQTQSRGPAPSGCHVCKPNVRRGALVLCAAGPAQAAVPMEKHLTVAKTWAIGALDGWGNFVERVSGRLGWQLITPNVCKAPLNGKVCIVTGANAGIGLATAELLAARGAHVILACRSRERGEAAAASLRQRCELLPGCQEPKLEVMEVDMASLKSVRDFCSRFNARGLPLHLLVANAGIMSPANRLETQDGLEMQFQVNFLGHWLMTHQLLAEQRTRRAAQKAQRGAALQAGARSESAAGSAPGALPGWGLEEDGTRVVMVSSVVHHAGMVDWNDMQSRKSYDPFTSYALSKMANAIAAVELQRRLDLHASSEAGAAWGHDSIVAVHPGVVDTYLANNFFKTQGLVALWPASKRVVEAVVDSVGPLFMKTTASSSAVIGCAALAPAHKVAGRYLVNGRPVTPARAVTDPQRGAQLWDVATQLTGLEIHESLR